MKLSVFPVATLVAVLGGAALASPAFALSDDGKATLKSIEYYEKSVDLKTRPFSDDADDNTISSAISQYEMKLKTVKERLAKVPEADRRDPLYVAKDAYAKQFEAKVSAWQAERAQAGQRRAKRAGAEEQLKTDRSNFGEPLQLVADVKAGKKPALPPEELLKRWNKATKLPELAARCASEYPSLKGSYYEKQKDETCATAAVWKETLTPFVATQLEDHLKKQASSVAGALTQIKKGSLASEYMLAIGQKPDTLVAKLEPAYKPLYEAIGKPYSAAIYAPILDAGKGFDDAIKGAQATVVYKAGKFSDALVTASVKDAATRDGLTVLKISQTVNDWSIKKGQGGFPTHRIRDSVVLAKAPGESFCRLYGTTSKQEYAGGGTYSKVTTTDLDRKINFQVASCK